MGDSTGIIEGRRGIVLSDSETLFIASLLHTEAMKDLASKDGTFAARLWHKVVPDSWKEAS